MSLLTTSELLEVKYRFKNHRRGLKDVLKNTSAVHETKKKQLRLEIMMYNNMIDFLEEQTKVE